MNQHERRRRRKFAALLNTELPQTPRRRYIDRGIPVAQLDMTEARRWFIPRCEVKR